MNGSQGMSMDAGTMHVRALILAWLDEQYHQVWHTITLNSTQAVFHHLGGGKPPKIASCRLIGTRSERGWHIPTSRLRHRFLGVACTITRCLVSSMPRPASPSAGRLALRSGHHAGAMTAAHSYYWRFLAHDRKTPTTLLQMHRCPPKLPLQEGRPDYFHNSATK